jgi:cell wall-active antibiotic response 4TMS protein YvqF
MADGSKQHCMCAHCRVRGLMAPLVLITVGVIFLVAQYTRFNFLDLWPVLLIVAGVVLLAQSLASREGHGGG